MFPNFDNLGEKTLNKIAEIALSAQFQQADQLSVQIKTDPNRLAKGMLESLVIKGQGLVINRGLRLQAMEIILFAIAVNPLKALRGNIQLTQPSQGSASFLFLETDLVYGINLAELQQHLNPHRFYLDGQQVTAEISAVNCQLGADQTLQLQVDFWLKALRETRFTKIQIKPRLDETRQTIVLDDYELLSGSDRHLSPLVVPTLLAQTARLLNLASFTIEGFSLVLTQIDITAGQLWLRAEVKMTQFPAKSLV